MRIVYHTDEMDMLPKEFYLFGFGANDVDNLAKRFFGDIDTLPTPSDIKDIDDYSFPGLVNGWKRIFFGHSDRWLGSVGSMKKSEGDHVYGVLTKIRREGRIFSVGPRKINLKGLFDVEGVDGGMYRFEPIATLGGLYVYAFIGNQDAFPPKKPPSKKYLNAIRKTIAYSGIRTRDIKIEYS